MMMSGPHTHIRTTSSTLIGDPPLRSLRFAGTSNTRLFDDIDDAELPRQRVRVTVPAAPTLRYGRMSRVVFLIPTRDDAEPRRIEVDSHIVRPSDIRSAGRTIRPRTARDEHSER